MTQHVSRTDHDGYTGADHPENVADPRSGHDMAVDGTRRGTAHDSDLGADRTAAGADPRGGYDADRGADHDGTIGTGRATSVPGTRGDQDMAAHDLGHDTHRGTGQVATHRQVDHPQAQSSPHADGPGESDREPLVPQQRATEYGRRWDAVKGGFVDEPRHAVAEADQIVAELLEELQKLFHDQRRDIEHGIEAESTSTEDLRMALRRYSSFFARLLSV
ncbi:hypothetical protein [Pseudonocardia alaniniphila]|uniref:Uncharacterized protein n=1 Tax=Pseudonocardia alaniniphila TaxID=75291 RepID=A0ABS9TQW2_9PSEU|nr:hypothetical protein [Pseudonocardia alaniniphila]MCH6170937.1 hypothetical protein [Pseudonocardia alaniniphila]